MEVLSEQRCHGGVLGMYRHTAPSTGTPMRLAVFRPPAVRPPGPVLTWLSGLTCTEETFVIKAGALPHAARLGLTLVCPDTSPRGLGLPGEDDDWDFGSGAGFYLDATAAPWAGHYNMASYVTEDLQALLPDFGVDTGRQGIFGHSMGGHGALVLGLRRRDLYRSISAFAPICAPTACPWGEKAFSGYLGDDRDAWRAWDAAALLAAVEGDAIPPEVLVDQGLDDQFLAEQLHPHLLEAAARQSGAPLWLRRHEGYDHSYWFIQSFIAEHLEHHARLLAA